MNDSEYKSKKKKRRFLMILLLLYTVTLCLVAYILGLTSGESDYYGQLIDTIVLNSGQSKNKTQSITIKGRVCYTNGEPYKNGMVEMHSDPMYTTTDDDGNFVFYNVELGKHSISIIQNGSVLAKCDVNFNKESQSDQVLSVKQSDGSYLIEMPTQYFVVMVKLVVKDKNIDITEADGSNAPETEPPARQSVVTAIPQTDSIANENPGPPSGESKQQTPTPVPTSIPTLPASTSHTKGSVPSGVTDDPGTTPHLEVGDSYSTHIWTQMSSIDIFATRTGNIGVRKIGKDNVIAPGSYGKYHFNIKNPESNNVIYSIRLTNSDSNVPSLPLKYRIFRGNSENNYSDVSDWKDASDISIKDYLISGGESQYFTFEWKWVSISDEQDTAIGTQSVIPSYILNIIVSAETQ